MLGIALPVTLIKIRMTQVLGLASLKASTCSIWNQDSSINKTIDAHEMGLTLEWETDPQREILTVPRFGYPFPALHSSILSLACIRRPGAWNEALVSGSSKIMVEEGPDEVKCGGLTCYFQWWPFESWKTRELWAKWQAWSVWIILIVEGKFLYHIPV